MSRPPYQSYPHHHPHYGRPYIVVHDHDVMSGRGVNIAQHPGNERFRALVTTRQDDTYCANFTTSEKRALAEEIITHVFSLDPPGRFLKRSGRSQSSRGLNGPWEELSHPERIKKTCQALRDCNRQDRQGYAAQVTAPTDVQKNAEERAQSGLSLKEQAVAAVAKADPAVLNPHHYNLNPPVLDQTFSAPESAAIVDQRKRSSNNFSATTADRLSPSVEHAAQWLKKQRRDDPSYHARTSAHTGAAPADPVLSTMSRQVHSTPAPLVAPVPVSTTPPSSHSHINGHMAHHSYHQPDHLAVHTTSPQMPSPATYNHHPEAVGPAPYSPVVLLSEDPDPNAGLDPHQPLDAYTSHDHHSQAFGVHHHHHSFNPRHDHHEHTGHQPNDVLQSAAASLDHHHHRNNSLSLIQSDDCTHEESLSISDL